MATDPRHEGRQVPALDLCHACDYHIWPGETVCPHCRADVEAAAAEHSAEVERRRAVLAEVERLIETAQP